MILRFSLYGFLKNVRLFEAFLVLALLDRGLDFLAIGALIAVRAIAVNLFEIPSGAIADGFGRKRSLVGSMAAYAAAYLVLAWAADWWLLALAMAMQGVGDAFRSGTHKALIYAWLRQQGRTVERTEVYGYTRSWSKLGSACSAAAGGAILLAGADYRWVFVASVIPALANLVNLATYPAMPDEPSGSVRAGACAAWRNLVAGLQAMRERPRIRSLVADAAAVEGGYAVAKDYLQALVLALAASLPFAPALDEQQRVGAIGGAIGTVLFLIAAAGSRRAGAFERRCGGAEAAVDRLAWIQVALFLALGLTLSAGWGWIAVILFIGLALAQNLWRPIHVGRFDSDGADQAHAATTLSIEE